MNAALHVQSVDELDKNAFRMTQEQGSKKKLTGRSQLLGQLGQCMH